MKNFKKNWQLWMLVLPMFLPCCSRVWRECKQQAQTQSMRQQRWGADRLQDS